MKRLLMSVCALGLAAAATPAAAQDAEIIRNGERDSIVGPSDLFTGHAIVDPTFSAKEQLPATGAYVTFSPGARSAWHTHPAGQMMIVTTGTGWVQEEGGEKVEVQPGDVVWTPPGVKHWHGATDSTSMTHFVISILEDGENVVWMEKVTDAQYMN